MKRIAGPGLVALLLAICSLAAKSAEQPESLAKTLWVPDGFTVELAAGPPLAQHPTMACFDDRGRLFVADNAGLNLPAEELLKQLPNKIRMLEDTDGDGYYDRSTVFADKMTFPQGAAWFRGALYVASPPSIWRLEDTNGDGVADRREELVQKFGFVGNAADIHGCFITPTGRVAWCDGRHGHELKDGNGQTMSKGLAARVFSCRPDGTDVEVFCGGGMDNPVEIAFTAEGDTLGTMTFYNPDAARHDALVHFVYGGVYPKKHPCTREFQRTGELMPALSRFGVTAPSGLARFVGAAWGAGFRDNLFSAHFNTHKILRHVLATDGATYRCSDEDFLVCGDTDFHPTDVLQDPDGSLLIVDTGGWFHIGCPTSQIAKPEVAGAIYRVRRQGATRMADPHGLKIDWARTSDTDMADLLADSRPAVVEKAIEVLVGRGDAAIGSLATVLFELSDYRAREAAVWTLARIGSENALLLLRQALADDDAPVRQAAVHAVSDLRDAQSLLPLIQILEKDEPAVRREAATALGRLRDPAAVGPLLQTLAQPADRFLDHALIFALIQLDDPQTTRKGLAHSNPNVQRGALIALDQMTHGELTREQVAPLLSGEDAALLRAAVEILQAHPNWAAELVGTVGAWLALSDPTEGQLALARGALLALLDRPVVQNFMAEKLADSQTSRSATLTLLEVIALGEFEKPPSTWNDALARSLGSLDEDLVRQAILAATALDVAPFQARLLKIGAAGHYSAGLRVAALQSAAKRNGSLDDKTFGFLIEQLRRDGNLRDRLAAAEALGRFQLTEPQLQATLELVRSCSSLEVEWLLRAYAGRDNAQIGLALVKALGESPARSALLPERLRELLASYPSEVRAAARPLTERSGADDAERSTRLATLEPLVGNGDAERGEAVFFSQRAACSACHRLGSRGDRIGPDLSKIGEVRNRRDLLEAIVFPSASLARGYESYAIVTKDGKVHNGLLSRETATALYLRTTDRAEIRLPRAEIEETLPSRASIMPQGLEKLLTPEELRDLIAFLQSLK